METLKELEQRLEELTKGFKKPQHLIIAKLLSEGKTQEEAYVLSGGKGKEPRKLGSQLILTNPDISEFVEVSKQITTIKSQEKQIATREQKRAMLWEAAQRCFQEVAPATAQEIAVSKKLLRICPVTIQSQITTNTHGYWATFLPSLAPFIRVLGGNPLPSVREGNPNGDL